MSRWPLIAAAMGCIACAGTSEDAAVRWAPLGASESYAGRALSDWATGWGRWSYAPTRCEYPDRDRDGSHCGDYQDQADPGFYLAGGVPGTVRERCKVPADRAIILPLTAFLTDNAGLPVEGWRSEDELLRNAERVHASMTDLRLTVDGVAVSELEAYGLGPIPFSYQLPPEPNWYSCNGMPGVTGAVEPAFITGYFVVLPPTAAGVHTLEYGGVTYFGNGRAEANAVTTTLTVE